MPLKPACIVCCSDCDASAVFTDCQHFICARCYAKYGPSGKCPKCNIPCRTIQCGSNKFPKDLLERIRADPHKMLKQTVAALEFQKKHEDQAVVRLKELVTILNNSNRSLSSQVQTLRTELAQLQEANANLNTELQGYRRGPPNNNNCGYAAPMQVSPPMPYPTATPHQQQQQPPSSYPLSAYPHQYQQQPGGPYNHGGSGDQTPTSWGRSGGGKRDRDVYDDNVIRPHRPSNTIPANPTTPPRSAPAAMAPTMHGLEPNPILGCMTPLLQLTHSAREAKRAQQQQQQCYPSHQQVQSRRSVSSHGDSEGGGRSAPALTGVDAFRLATPAITLRGGLDPSAAVESPHRDVGRKPQLHPSSRLLHHNSLQSLKGHHSLTASALAEHNSVSSSLASPPAAAYAAGAPLPRLLPRN